MQTAFHQDDSKLRFAYPGVHTCARERGNERDDRKAERYAKSYGLSWLLCTGDGKVQVKKLGGNEREELDD